MWPPGKKRRKKKTTPNPSLPDDLLLSCLARVSSLHYPALSLVSKSFRSLLTSPELYKARSLLGRTESCLYVYSQDSWFTLCRKPKDTNKKKSKKKKALEKNSSEYVLAKVPIPNSPHANFQGLVTVGSSIYSIGGSRFTSHLPQSSVSILDCTSHTWSNVPSLPVQLSSLSATVVDRMIYVAGRYKYTRSGPLKNSIQVFDTETQTWDPKPILCSETNGDLYDKTACVNGKLHVVTERDQRMDAYNSKEGKWDVVGQRMGDCMFSDSYCVINNILCSCYNGLRWYDTKLSSWKKLKGLVGLPMIPDSGRVRLADYGGNMAVLWREICPVTPSCTYIVWCTVIKLIPFQRSDIWGKVEWFDQVLRVPSYDVVKVLAVTV